MLERSHSNRLERNTIFGSSGSAVLMEGSNNNTVVSNDLSENAEGVKIDITRTGTVGEQSNNNRVEKNTILEPSGACARDPRVGREPAARQRRPLRQRRGHLALPGGRQRPARERRQRQQGRHRPGRLERQPARGQRRQRLRQHRHLGRVALAEQHASEERVVAQRRRRHLHRRRDDRRLGVVDRGQHGQQQQGLRHLRLQGQPRHQGEPRQRQRRLGHLGERRLERPPQHGRRWQQGTGQPRTARPDHPQAAPVLHDRLHRRGRADQRHHRARHAAAGDAARPELDRRSALPLRRQRQREPDRHVPMQARRGGVGPVLVPRGPRSAGRHPHVRGPRRGRGREHRPDVRRHTSGGSIRPSWHRRP